MPSNYSLLGSRWGTGPMGTSGGTVTWSVDATIEASWVKPIENAFADWAKWANISFAKVSTGGNIQFTEAYIDGPRNTLGNAAVGSMDGRMQTALVTVDSAEDYHLVNGRLVDTNVARESRSFDYMVKHEIGHALGLDHVDLATAPALMNPKINSDVVSGLTKSDIDGIQALYGARPGAPAATAWTGLEQSDAVFRFYDTKTGDHFYTTDVMESLSIQANMKHFNYEGVAWGAPHKQPGTIDVFRFYDHKSGEHFFTTSAGERDEIIKKLPTYQYEGVAFQAYDREGGPGTVTLDRFYNNKTGVHHFSASAQETAWIKAGNAGEGWAYEGHGFTVTAPSDYLLHA